jgi:hypothetical protein
MSFDLLPRYGFDRMGLAPTSNHQLCMTYSLLLLNVFRLRRRSRLNLAR